MVVWFGWNCSDHIGLRQLSSLQSIYEQATLKQAKKIVSDVNQQQYQGRRAQALPYLQMHVSKRYFFNMFYLKKVCLQYISLEHALYTKT